MLYAQEKNFDKLIKRALDTLTVETPDEGDPVRLAGTLVVMKDSVAIVIKAAIQPGWHIYQHVPEHLPYQMTSNVLKAPENVSKEGKWVSSPPAPSLSDQGVWVYKNVVWFVYKTVKSGELKAPIISGLYYQACDINQCLPPVEKTVELVMPKF